ncbi:olfactory receptor 5B12-like [Vombatus ursinus]|uniref:olfactory receptor 5B12-like n=1 Tax=Vombatus ursinus TaxID=29139 RepID=UPI000FFD7712|nr:olfactory receptor 5B12-like [Vombatus ursinus]
MENCSKVEEFILLGLTNSPELQVPLFIIFTIIYFITLVGNLGLLFLISWDSHLHTPMNIFLSNLSLADLGYSSAITSKVLPGFHSGDKTTSYGGCAMCFATIESYLLAAMAYDHQVAVCKPLHYHTTMTSRVCAHLAIGCYVCGFLNSSTFTGNTFTLHFCHSNVIHHFFGDIPPLFVLSSSVTYINQLVVLFSVVFHSLFALFFILKSYFLIFNAILSMCSSEGHQKAFSTCATHLTAVSIFYGTAIFTYLHTITRHNTDTDKIASVFYTMVTPMLNPLVYSLRNKEVMSSFKKIVNKSKYSLDIFF